MSERRGGSLELAILRASREYHKDGRKITIVKQEPRMANAGMVGRAPVDFIGVLDGKAIAIEAKEVTVARGKSLPIRRLEDLQQKLMGRMHNCGADVSLICYFACTDEAYRVWWPEIATFLATGWRKSFSLAWFRANGVLVDHEQRGEQWYVMFMNTRLHPEKEKAVEEIDEERVKKGAFSTETDEGEPERGSLVGPEEFPGEDYPSDGPEPMNFCECSDPNNCPHAQLRHFERISNATKEGIKRAEEREKWKKRPAWRK